MPVPTQTLARIKKRDPVAYTVITNPQKHATLTQLIYRGHQHHHTNTPYTAVGNKVHFKSLLILPMPTSYYQEMSGFAENYPPFIGTKSTGHQPTHYSDKYCFYSILLVAL